MASPVSWGLGVVAGPCERSPASIEDEAASLEAEQNHANLEDAPAQAEVDEWVASVRSYLPDIDLDWEHLSTADAEHFAVESVRSWARQQGIPLSEQDIVSAARGYVEDETGVHIPEDVTWQSARQAAIDAACIAAQTALGIDPRIGVVTYEALTSGNLDTATCEAVGSVVGAVVVGAALQAFGIPAPIGAWLGANFGGMIGGTVAAIFGLTAAERRERRDRIRRELCQAYRDWNQQLADSCDEAQALYQQRYDQYIQQIATTWQSLEDDLGDWMYLKWFEKAPDPAARHGWFFSHSRPEKACTGAPAPGARMVQDEFYCRRPGVKCRKIRRPVMVAGSTSSMRADLRCWCEDEAGCSYPTGDQVRNPATGARYHSIVISQRAESALVARGASPPTSSCAALFPEPSCSIINQAPNARCQWQNNLMAKLRREWARIESLDRSANQVTLDLIRTAATRHAVKYAEDNQQELRTEGTSYFTADVWASVAGQPVASFLAKRVATHVALSREWKQSKRQRLLQFGVLAGGAAALAGVLAGMLSRRRT